MRTSSAVRQSVPFASLAAVLTLLLPPISAAQPVKSFDQLDARLKPGDTVYVTDAQGRAIEGRITELHDASITLANATPTTLQADNVRLVQKRTKSVGRAALWGLLIGCAAGAVASTIESNKCTSDCMGGAGLVGGAIGAGIGAGVGAVARAVLPARRKEVYRAPGASGSARFSIAPVLTVRTKGVALSYSF